MQIAAVSSAPVHINLLGGFSIVVRGDRRCLPTRKVDALLAYMAFHLEERIHRLTIASIIWPSKKTKDARHCLNQAIYSIRQTIPELVIESDRDYLTLSASNVLVDYSEFVGSLSRGAFADAEQSFEGQFLEGMQFTISDDFEEWVEEVRGAVTHIAVPAFEELVANLPHAASATIERVASKLLRLQPENRKAMVALRFAERGTVDDSVVDAAALQYANPRLGRLPFRGRDNEIRIALTHLAAASNSAQLLLVVGQQGVGKTRFAEQVMRIAALRGAKVYASDSAPGEQRVPFTLVQSLLNVLDTDQSERNPTGRSLGARKSDEDQDRHLISAASRLERVLERAAESGSLVVAVDDYQWIDRASRITLRRCIHRLRGFPVLFVICSRFERLRYKKAIRHLQHSLDSTAFRTIHLHRLSDKIITDLLEDREKALGISLAPDFRNAVVRTTKGHPLYLSEIVAALSASPRALESTELQQSLDDFLRLRVRKLQPNARHCLRALAAIGRPAGSAMIAKVSGLQVCESVSCLRAGAKAGLIARRGKEWTFAHEVVRSTLYASTPTRVKQQLHHRVALALQEMGGEAARIALHAVRAGDRNVAFRAALTAAEEVRPLEWLGGADYFLRLAFENAPTGEDRFRASWRLAAYFMFAHRFPAAQEAWSECAKCAPPPELPLAQLGLRLAQLSRAAERADSPASQILDSVPSCFTDLKKLTSLAGSAIVACSCVGNVALDQGRTDVLLKLVAILQDLASVAATQAERSAAAGLVTTLLCHVGRVDESNSWAARAVREAEDAKDELTLVRALGAHGACLMFDARPREAMAVLAGCRQRAKESGLAELYASTVLNYVVSILDSGEFKYVDDVIDDVRDELAAEWGHRQIYVHMNLCLIRYEQGYYREAERLADDVLLENHILGSHCIHSNAWGVLGLCALYRNDRVRAQRAFDEIARTIDLVLGTADCTYPLLFLGRYWEIRGNTSQAIAQLKVAVEFTSTRYRTCWALLRTELARLTLRLDRTASMRTLGEIEDWAATRACGLVVTHVHRARRNMPFPTRS